MMQKEQLTKYVETIVNNNKNKYNFYFPGFFNDNHILFVGICPNLPDTNTKFYEDMCFVRDSNNIQKAYEDKLLLTPLGQYILDITKSTKHISFTNFFKFATKDYESIDNDTTTESKKVLDQQIFLLQPNVVVLFGQWLGKKYNIDKFYDYKKINDVYYVMVPHHSFVNRTGQHDRIVYEIKESINNFFKLHAVTRVTSNFIYYRDCEFQKCTYKNEEKDDFCFIQSAIKNAKSEYKSFDGRNLKKVSRKITADDNSYERHLKKKDIWYYNHCKDIQHSKCLRALHYDIETNFCNDVINTPKEIISIAFFDTFQKNYYQLVLNINNQKINTKFLNARIKAFDDEKSMLIFFFEIMKEFDIINGYYSNKFDFPYIINRATKLDINVEKYFEFLRIFIDKKEVEVKQEPYILYDTMHFYQKLVYVSKPPSFSLNNVSKYLFGDNVQKLDHAEGVDVLWQTKINKLIEYNLQDVKLLKDICERINAFMYPFRLQQIVPQDFENCFYNSKTIENMLHQEYWQKQIYFPTKIKHHKEDFEGALVLNPVAGIHSNVAVFDFNCLLKDTVIKTVNGDKKIQDIQKGDIIIGIIKNAEVNAINKSKTNKIFKIKLKSGKEIFATENHKFMINNNNCIKIQQVKNIKIKDKLFEMNNKFKNNKFKNNKFKNNTFKNNKFKNTNFEFAKEISDKELKTQQHTVCKKGKYKFNDIHYKSSCEANFAEFLFNNNIKFEYEKYSFKLKNNQFYIPDFYLNDYDIFVGIKRYKSQDFNNKWKLFLKQKPNSVLIDVNKINKLEECLFEILLNSNNIIEDEIESIEEIEGQFEVYDINIKNALPYFVANDIISHNSMYTHIYLSNNISPDTLVGEKEKVESNLKIIIEDLKDRYPQIIEKFADKTDEEIKDNFILLNTDFGKYYFLPQEYKLGILPALEMKALALRKYYVKERNKYNPTSPEYITYEDLQGTAKAILNSVYGITSYEKFILFNPVVSSAITTIARELNIWVQDKTKEKQYLPLYSDTDSIFVAIKTQNNKFEEALEISKDLEDYLNGSFKDFMARYTQNLATINNHKHHIECEKIFTKMLITNVKKRYFGLVKLFKGQILEKPEMKITGFEVRRDDTPNYFKKILKQSYYLFFEDDYKSKLNILYNNVKKEIKTLNTSELIIKIKLSRDMDSYTNLPIHVRALKNSKTEIRRGEVINMIYVKDAREVLHYDESLNLKFELDYDKYINNFFVNKLLLIDKSLTTVLSNQKALFNF